MKIEPSWDTRIALITDDSVISELIRDAHRGLAQYVSQFPDAERFARMSLVSQYTSTDKAAAECLGESARVTLGLVVLDAAVRAKDMRGTPGDSAAAMTLLDRLTATIPHVPVVVLASASVDGLGLRQINREKSNIRALDLSVEDFPLAYAKALHETCRVSRERRLITVEVGDYAARYFLMEGEDLLSSGECPYRNLTEIYHLLDRVRSYSPINEGCVAPDWRSVFEQFGDEVFNSFIAGTIGKYIVDHYRDDEYHRHERTPIELRFDINVDPNGNSRLFDLPFELAKPPEYGSDFLCTRVPMARRIRFMSHARQGAGGYADVPERSGHAEFHPELKSGETGDARHAGSAFRSQDRPLRLLFIDASFSGSATLINEETGTTQIIPGLRKLTNTADELKVVKAFTTSRSAPRLESVTSICATTRTRTSAKFREKIEDLVGSNRFDILHFSGHSVNLPGNGGTFLILPDESGCGTGVSVRVVAEWVRDADISMVMLSSCSGSSLRTSIEMMRSGADSVLGFRWDVNDHACVEYIQTFYRLYLRGDKSVAEAYCGACNKTRSSTFGLPIWASAIAVVKD